LDTTVGTVLEEEMKQLILLVSQNPTAAAQNEKPTIIDELTELDHISTAIYGKAVWMQELRSTCDRLETWMKEVEELRRLTTTLAYLRASVPGDLENNSCSNRLCHNLESISPSTEKHNALLHDIQQAGSITTSSISTQQQKRQCEEKSLVYELSPEKKQRRHQSYSTT